MEFFDEQEMVVLGQNLACIRISLYCNIKFVWQPAWKALFSYSTCILAHFFSGSSQVMQHPSCICEVHQEV